MFHAVVLHFRFANKNGACMRGVLQTSSRGQSEYRSEEHASVEDDRVRAWYGNPASVKANSFPNISIAKQHGQCASKVHGSTRLMEFIFKKISPLHRKPAQDLYTEHGYQYTIPENGGICRACAPHTARSLSIHADADIHTIYTYTAMVSLRASCSTSTSGASTTNPPLPPREYRKTF